MFQKYKLKFNWFIDYLNFSRTIAPVENRWVSYATGGEGWHNYHHIFPYDYKTSEYGHYNIDLTTLWIDMFAKIGWAYDLRQPGKDIIESISEKKGDGSKEFFFFFNPDSEKIKSEVSR